MNHIAQELERLISYALERQLIESYDVIPARNYLLDLLRVEQPAESPETTVPPSSEAAMKPILDYCVAKGLIDDSIGARDAMDARIFGALMPRASEVVRRFRKALEESPVAATDYLVRISEDSNYIQVNRIKQNLLWNTAVDFGTLDITINLSKPEKDPKEIAAARLAVDVDYPKCLICKENAGYAGNGAKPARQNLRVVPITLAGEEWFLQYSPYAYYSEHCIILKNEHTPMKLTQATFTKLFDFLEQFPHYFVGSNADIPIVGGSILSHDHFQGGRHIFPLNHAKKTQGFSHKDYEEIGVAIVDWPLSTIRLEARPQAREALEALAWAILEKWRGYSDGGAEIYAYTQETPHNTITPIARMNDAGLLEMDLVLRNNRTSAEHPLGIFHPHQELHHIKKENIGLIEVMGLAILPGRLKPELALVEDILSGRAGCPDSADAPMGERLRPHYPWAAALVERYGTQNTPAQAEEIVRRETGLVFAQVLEHAGVYKRTEEGRTHFYAFMKHCGFEKI